MLKDLWIILLGNIVFSAIWLLFLYFNEVLKEEKYKKYRKIFILNMILVEICLVMIFFRKELSLSEEILFVLILLTFMLVAPYSILIESKKMLITVLEAFNGSKEHLRKLLLGVFIIFLVIFSWMFIVGLLMPSKSRVEDTVKEHTSKIGHKVEKIKTDWWRKYLGKLMTFNIEGESIICFENELIEGYYFLMRGSRRTEKIEIWIYKGEKTLRYRWENNAGNKKASIEYITHRKINGKGERESEVWEVDPDTGEKIKLVFKGLIK